MTPGAPLPRGNEIDEDIILTHPGCGVLLQGELTGGEPGEGKSGEVAEGPS